MFDLISCLLRSKTTMKRRQRLDVDVSLATILRVAAGPTGRAEPRRAAAARCGQIKRSDCPVPTCRASHPVYRLDCVAVKSITPPTCRLTGYDGRSPLFGVRRGYIVSRWCPLLITGHSWSVSGQQPCCCSCVQTTQRHLYRLRNDL